MPALVAIRDNDFSDGGDLDQDRTHNDANEISGIRETGGQAAWVDPVYDLAGNMTEGPAPGGAGGETSKHKYVYDAWNRLVEVTDASDVTIATYEYDGLNRRIAKTDELADPDVDYDYYYDESWRVLEVRKDADTDPLHQYVWQPPGVYIDALAIDYYDADTDNADIEELYATFDANMNVTALTDSSGNVIERYEYDAYGQPTVLDADFSADGDGLSDKENDILFGGYRYDPESGLYHVRNRMLHPSLGRWMQRDPDEYVDGSSLSEFAGSRPSVALDPLGTRWGLLLHQGAQQQPAPTPWLVPISVVGCPSYVRALLSDPDVRAILEQIYDGCGCVPWIKCAVCPQDPTKGPTCGSYDGNPGYCSRVTLCVTATGQPACGALQTPIPLRTTLIHELIHARQYCTCSYGGWKFCRQRICMEYEAYDAEQTHPGGACQGMQGQTRINCLCDRTCYSVPREPLCCDCYNKCKQQIAAGQCAGGCFKP